VRIHEEFHRYKQETQHLSLVCSPNPCWNGGNCVTINGGSDYYCVCPSGLPLAGKNCDQVVSTTTTGLFHPMPWNMLSNIVYFDNDSMVTVFIESMHEFRHMHRQSGFEHVHVYMLEQLLWQPMRM
jgi:hypothetical protein